MQSFRLRTGHKVTAQRVDNDIEFVTYGRNGDVISSVRHSFAESVPLIRRMRCHG
ncbi:hypothetical protein [Streptomyces sp. NBC_01244]|uniref:hypothetical protein n=1 Tax=Streptomyces sp. NBC_01244 TaxID=2903797 RepID=UPI002E163A7E|nr:hypothetical protein OG247_17930 [Streptomyces sp. NBC_01244]